MHKTRIDLSEKTRRKVTDLLNARLADAIDLQTQAKHAHWNVKGPNFIALHELFDDIAENIEEHVDLLAERVTALGGTAEGVLATVAKRTSLDPYPQDITDGLAHVDALASALATFGRKARKAIDESGKLGDADTVGSIYRHLARCGQVPVVPGSAPAGERVMSSRVIVRSTR